MNTEGSSSPLTERPSFVSNEGVGVVAIPQGFPELSGSRTELGEAQTQPNVDASSNSTDEGENADAFAAALDAQATPADTANLYYSGLFAEVFVQSFI